MALLSSGIAQAGSSPDVVGQKYSDASSAISGAGMRAVVSTVVGDQKYGKEERDRLRLALHARSISFQHPFSGERLTFAAAVPAFLVQLVGNVDMPPRP